MPSSGSGTIGQMKAKAIVTSGSAPVPCNTHSAKFESGCFDMVTVLVPPSASGNVWNGAGVAGISSAAANKSQAATTATKTTPLHSLSSSSKPNNSLTKSNPVQTPETSPESECDVTSPDTKERSMTPVTLPPPASGKGTNEQSLNAFKDYESSSHLEHGLPSPVVVPGADSLQNPRSTYEHTNNQSEQSVFDIENKEICPPHVQASTEKRSLLSATENVKQAILPFKDNAQQTTANVIDEAENEKDGENDPALARAQPVYIFQTPSPDDADTEEEKERRRRALALEQQQLILQRVKQGREQRRENSSFSRKEKETDTKRLLLNERKAESSRDYTKKGCSDGGEVVPESINLPRRRGPRTKGRLFRRSHDGTIVEDKGPQNSSKEDKTQARHQPQRPKHKTRPRRNEVSVRT